MTITRVRKFVRQKNKREWHKQKLPTVGCDGWRKRTQELNKGLWFSRDSRTRPPIKLTDMMQA